jgi:hypothetical protein
MPTATSTIIQTLCQLGVVFIDSLLFFKPASKTSFATCDSGTYDNSVRKLSKIHPARVASVCAEMPIFLLPIFLLSLCF